MISLEGGEGTGKSTQSRRLAAALENTGLSVLTTREPQEFQDRAIGLAGVISPGSPDVAPYRADSQARNEQTTSQFLVADLRRPRHILGRIEAGGTKVGHFANPSVGAAVLPAG